MRLALLLLALLALVGCGPERVAVAAAADGLAQAAPAGESSDLVAARTRLAQAEADLASARALVDGLEQAASEARREGHRRLLAWASGLALLGILACGAAAIFLPVLRARLAVAAGACAAVLVLAQTLAVALPWLPLVGVALALAALFGLAVALWYRLRAAIASVRVAADKNDPSWPALRQRLLRAQGGEGSPVQRDLDRLAKRGAA